MDAPDFLNVSAVGTNPTNANTTATTDGEVKQPAFVTTQTLATFGGASVAIAAVWKALAGGIDASWVDERWVPAVLCGLFSIWLILAGLENADSASKKFGVFLIGAFNGIILWATVIGVDVGLDRTGVADSTGS